MKGKTKRLLPILLAVAMALALLAAIPMTASAADGEITRPITDNNITRPRTVPKNVKTGEELQLAIEEGADGDVIRLANDIKCGQIKFYGDKAITLDLNGKTLTAEMLEMRYGGSLLLLDPENGEFNLTGKNFNFPVLLMDGAKAEVTNIKNEKLVEPIIIENSGGYYQYQNSDPQTPEQIPIGDLGVGYHYEYYDPPNEEPIPIGDSGEYYYYNYQLVCGAGVFDGSELIVHGNVASYGVGIYSSNNSKTTVKGDVECRQNQKPVPVNNPGGYYLYQLVCGANISNGSEFIVHGSVMSDGLGMSAGRGCKIAVNGNVECKQKEHCAVNLGEGDEITVEGEIIVANEEMYIYFYMSGAKAKKEFERISSKPGYVEYKWEDPQGELSSSYVWVKSPVNNSRPTTPIREPAPAPAPVPAPAEAFPFLDIANSPEWIYENVKAAWEMGLINGKTDTEFMPDDNLTYAEAVKLAACMHQFYTDGEVTLDIAAAPNKWYDSYVAYAKQNGIISGNYAWENMATRAGYMNIFANALPDEALAAINEIADDSIPDVPMSHAPTGAIYRLYRAGIVQGVDAAHSCNPGANIRRSEVAAILVRMMDPAKRIKFDM